MRLSDAEFRRRHRDHISSAWWKAFRKRALGHYDFACAVCGRDYSCSPWQLIVDHKAYRKNSRLIFGLETFSDVRVLCASHNVRGAKSDAFYRHWRAAYRWRKRIAWIARSLWRLLRRQAQYHVAGQNQNPTDMKKHPEVLERHFE